MIKWLWTANGIILGLALLILMIGVAGLPGSSLINDKLRHTNGLQNTGEDDPLAADRHEKESLLVAMARKYSARLNPSKPKPKPVVKPRPAPKPVPKPKSVVQPKPAPKPKPTPPPKPVIPPPSFAVEATLMIGEHGGLAWIKPPKAIQPKLYAVGEKIGPYEIVKIENGLVELIREAAKFTIKVPEPKKTAASPLPPTLKKNPVKKRIPRRPRRRPTRIPKNR